MDAGTQAALDDFNARLTVLAKRQEAWEQRCLTLVRGALKVLSSNRASSDSFAEGLVTSLTEDLRLLRSLPETFAAWPPNPPPSSDPDRVT